MAEFNLQPRLDAAESEPSDAEELLSSYADAHETVTLATEPAGASEDDRVLIPGEYLEIDGVERFAQVYTDLVEEPEVVEAALWGPTAERFPVRVKHYALQQIGQPDLYEFHALDGQVTLVIAESKLEAEQVQREVPAPALG